MTFSHLPVLAAETLAYLDPQAGDVALDGTVGLGGHSSLIAARLGADGHLIALDRDAAALAVATEKLAAAPCRVTLRHSPFSQMAAVLTELGVGQVNRILLDLGVSSMQLDDAARGFSFRDDAALDMRMDRTQELTAAAIVNTWGERELADIFYRYGEERAARRVARRISEIRARQPINTTAALAEMVASVIPRRGKIHPATKVFQALRLAVNDELGELEQTLPVAFDRLAVGGRLAVIAFHSLEDRIVKNYFRELATAKKGFLPHKKAIMPAAEEVLTNRRARSAKLRVIEKI